ncbi:MAG: 3-hydroxyacyl-ACP dehydratase [Bacteroidetes bacterium]|jgi:3-hydroxyacyl-[acyl-carrier-protein] dehydratase|nr:3-hydroxyacyl-ACP dehydratase [Bacteroidota bacterium]
MLKDSFFFIQNHEQGVYRIRLNVDHDIFKGHFPENPVTPGVVMIQMLTELMNIHCEKGVRLISVSSCKFSKTLNPFEFPFVNFILKTSAADENVQVSAQVAEEDVLFCKIAAVYK